MIVEFVTILTGEHHYIYYALSVFKGFWLAKF